MGKYIVSMKYDTRVDVEVEADSFAEAFEKARDVEVDMGDLEYVDDEPVNATDEKGVLKDYR